MKFRVRVEARKFVASWETIGKNVTTILDKLIEESITQYGNTGYIRIIEVHKIG